MDSEEHFLAIEQLLPPASARTLIEKQREESRGRKYARDRVRVAFMQAVEAALRSTAFKTDKKRGQQYECRITNAAWPKDASASFSVNEKHPVLWVPANATCDKSNLRVEPRTEEGYVRLVFGDIEAGAAQYSENFENRLQALLKSLEFPPVEGSPRNPELSDGVGIPHE